MASPARVGVFLCQGGRTRADSLEYKRLRWAAETGAPGGRVYEITQACQAEGARALARLAQEEGLTSLLLGACPLAGPSGPLTQALLERGLDPAMVSLVEVCQRPEDGLEECQVEGGAHFALCQSLAAVKERQEPESQTLEVCTRVLVVGAGLAALTASRDLAAGGYQVLLITPDKRLAPPEPLLGPEAAEAAAALAEEVRSSEQIEVLPRGELLGLAGPAGRFQALVRDREEGLRRYEVGAVVMAQGPPQELNLGDWEMQPSPRVLSLSGLAALVSAPQHLQKLAGAEAPRVGLVVGLAREADPASLRAALRLGRDLVGELGAQVMLFTGNLKVAAPDLEELSQTARAEGVALVKFRQGGIRPRAEDAGVTVDYFEEILQMPIRQELDLLAVDERPAPDRAYRELARCLGLGVSRDGSLQPEAVNALPTLSARGGVFLVGPAQGSRDLETTLDQVQEALWQVRRLLGKGQAVVEAGLVKVDRKACALCLTCLRVCPQGAMGRVERRPTANPLTCTGCGTCAAECPMDAIQLLNQEDARYRAEIKAGLSTPWQLVHGEPAPEMLVLACANSAGQALRAARLEGVAWPEDARLVRVPCAGKIDPEMVLHAFREGFDAVLVLACHPQACYSLSGNTWADLRLDHLRVVLEEAGFPHQRLMAASVAPNMGREAMELVQKALARTKEMGPSPLKIEARVRDVLSPYTLNMDQSYTIF